MKRSRLLALGLLLLGAFPTDESLAQTGANVLLVVNDNSPESLRIGAYYRERRGVPAAGEVHLSTTLDEEISREYYEETIEAPIAEALARERMQDRVVFIVLTRGVPIRIAGTRGRDGTMASVDSELALLYRKLVAGCPCAVLGRVPNPFFAGEAPAAARRFDRERDDIYLVARLDGFSVEDAIALVDRGSSPATGGPVVLQPHGAASPSAVQRMGNGWLEAAAVALRQARDAQPVILTGAAAGGELSGSPGAIGYFSWGSMDPRLRRRSTALEFAPGAIGGLFVGAAARTFREPPEGWTPGTTRYAGSADSLAGDLVRDGLSGVGAHVAEGYLDGMIRPDILFPAYAAGLTLGEAFYRATPSLSWQNVVLGDPLCAPFARAGGPGLSADAPIDPVTELPVFFSRRRLGVLSAAGIPENAAKLLLRADSRNSRDDRPGAIEALREALELSPRFYLAALRLAVLLEQTGDPAAAEAYRRVLDIRPGDAVALNNLALLLAGGGDLDGALPLAEQAFAAAPRSGAIADTLGWIHHLRGNDAEGARLIEQALATEPRDASIRLHAAIVFFSRGDRERAKRELYAALSLDPALRDHPDVTRLLEQLR
jgi:uncharacterized protein (TIGR03790 family)